MDTSNYDEGMIDLGKPMSKDSPMVMGDGASTSKSSKTVYPTLFIQDVDELDDLPEGEFYFMAKGKVTRHTEEDPVDADEAGSHCSCEITVMSMKPLGDAAEQMQAAEDSEESGDGLAETLDKMEKSKADAEEPGEDMEKE